MWIHPIIKKINTPICKKSIEGINKNVKDNNIKYNIDDLFHLIINNSNEIPEGFLAIIDRLEFNYKPYMLQYMKEDKMVFTTTGRRFIGLFNINGFEYLAYQILKEHDNKYIESIAYDIQKEMKYKNIIILVNDINRIDLSNFAFGTNQILVIEDNAITREKLKYLHSIRWKEVVGKCYKNVHLSEFNFCEYTNNKDKFINTFYFIDTEKINRFKYFINESSTKRAYIICNTELETKLRKELPNANYCVVDLEKYIDKERRYYYC